MKQEDYEIWISFVFGAVGLLVFYSVIGLKKKLDHRKYSKRL